MKKIVYFLLIALCLPIGLMAQSVDDDLLLYVPLNSYKSCMPQIDCGHSSLDVHWQLQVFQYITHRLVLPSGYEILLALR